MKAIIGIDFGTTNSEVAVFRRGRPRILPDRDGGRVMPSVVYIDESGRRYIGQEAKNVAILYPDRTVKSVKRELGTSRRYRIGDQEYGPEDVASFIFAALKERAETALGGPVCQVVVTVPAYFDDPRRQATKRAAALAGLEVVRLLNEPTAAALAYGVDSAANGTILVYDLGGGTFDVSVLQAGDGVFQVLATRGDTGLGGDDFDRAFAGLLLERFEEETGIDLKNDRLAFQKISQEAERLKIELSANKTAKVDIPFLAVNAQGPCHLMTSVRREEFEELIAEHLERTVRLTRGALQDAGLAAEQIDRILLVGGSTRIPAVRRCVEQLFGRSPETGVSPEELVACGAAIQGAILAGEIERMALVDVTPLGLGIETERRNMTVLMPRNTILPAQARAVFTTVADNQSSACIKVLQGERPRASDNITLGSFLLEGLKQRKRGEPDIEVCFEIDVEGIVHASAEDLETGSRRHIKLDGLGNLGEEQIRDILIEARAAELEDILERHDGVPS